MPCFLEDSREITRHEAWVDRDDGIPSVEIPDFVGDVLEEVAFAGRDSEYVDQTSGVSARLAIAARELLVSQVERRLIQNPDASPVARPLRARVRGSDSGIAVASAHDHTRSVPSTR